MVNNHQPKRIQANLPTPPPLPPHPQQSQWESLPLWSWCSGWPSASALAEVVLHFSGLLEPPRRFGCVFFSTGSHAAEESHHSGALVMRENTNSETQKSHIYVFQKRSSSMNHNKTLKVKLADLSKCLQKGDLKQGVAV